MLGKELERGPKSETLGWGNSWVGNFGRGEGKINVEGGRTLCGIFPPSSRNLPVSGGGGAIKRKVRTSRGKKIGINGVQNEFAEE